jgi:hypothetical protein
MTTPQNTAKAHAVVMAMSPPPFPLVPGKITLATTPVPKRSTTAVPINSATNGFILPSF